MKVIIQLLCGGVQFQVKIPWNKTIVLSEINTKMSSDVKIVCHSHVLSKLGTCVHASGDELIHAPNNSYKHILNAQK